MWLVSRAAPGMRVDGPNLAFREVADCRASTLL